MSLPSGAGYVTTTPDNPGAALTDFTFLVDLSTLPQSWWDDVNTTNGTYGRACKDDGTTELPCDWIDFNSTAQTGLLAIKYSGTKSATLSEPVRIFAPNTRNTAYAAGDTYGQYNAYSPNISFYSPNGADNDRTVNQNTVSYTGTPTEDAEIGRLGKATHYQTGAYGSVSGISTPSSHYMCAIGKTTGTPYLFGDFGRISLIRPYNGTYRYYHNLGSKPDGTYTEGVYNIFQARVNSDGTAGRIGVNGSYTDFTGTEGNVGAIYDIGRDSDVYAQHVIKLNVDPGNDYIAYDYAQLSDNSSFWSTPTWVSGQTGTAILADLLSLTSAPFPPALSAGASFTGGLQHADITGLATVIMSGATISPDLQPMDADYLAAILTAGATVPANIQSVDIAPFSASFQTGNSISAELVAVNMTPQQAEFIAGVVAAQGVQPVGIDVLTPTFRAETLIISPIVSVNADALAPTFDLGGDYIRAELLTVDSGLFAPSFGAGVVLAAGLQTVEFQFLDAALAELGKITGLMKVSFSGAVPGADFTGAVPSVILIGEVE